MNLLDSLVTSSILQGVHGIKRGYQNKERLSKSNVILNKAKNPACISFCFLDPSLRLE